MAERLGILGGTFDPIHLGHLAIAEAGLGAADLNRVLFVVANEPWQKANQKITDASGRLAMVEAATSGCMRFEASDLEIRRGGKTYTVDTLRELAGSDRELFLIIGGDIAGELLSWERADEVRELAELVVVCRPGDFLNDVPKGWRGIYVEGPQLECSSSELRRRLSLKEPIQEWVAPEVLRIIKEQKLYGWKTNG